MPSQDEVAINNVINTLVDSWNRHDIRAFGALFVEDADFVDVFGNWFKSRPEFEEALTTRHATVFKGSRFATNEVAIRTISQAFAVAHTVMGGVQALL
jgi:uncharacterized protein (TIGR02246 family)